MSGFQKNIAFAQELDHRDELSSFRSQFLIPMHQGKPVIYLCGNSLGLQPVNTRAYVLEELDDWARFGVEGHFHARHPWMPYHEFLTPALAKITGAKETEVVAMNALSVNLHLMMVSFYRPTPQRYKILIEGGAFPSDEYAVQSQAAFHGYRPEDAILRLTAADGAAVVPTEEILKFIHTHGHEIALILLGGVNYYSGQLFDLEAITAAGRAKGCVVGFDLAHVVGNVPLRLHDWGVDFAAWCSYKYLNSSPGGVAGVFIHERHHQGDLPRFAGWWGQDKDTRFRMEPEFTPIPTVEGWQLSNAPVLGMAAQRASLELFEQAGMDRLRAKSLKLTAYLEFLLEEVLLTGKISLITPRDPEQRGCQLSLRTHGNGRKMFQYLSDHGVICDWREPDVIRIAPVPLYNTFEDVYRFSELLLHAVQHTG